MKRSNQIVQGGDSRALVEFFAKEGQLPLPMLDLGVDGICTNDPERLKNGKDRA